MASITIPDPLTERLRTAEHVVALTGAGISAESGLPTFRDKQTGLWAQYRPEELATPEAFARQPELVWRWYEWRRSLVAAAEPNAGHRALTELADRVPRLTLITQNVDGLHHRAGSRDVVELHGRITRTRCSAEDRIVESWPDTETVPPRCPACGAPLRPDVVWFGEALPAEALHRAMDAASVCDVFFSIGTSGLVFPAASLLPLATRSGAAVAVVNTKPQEGTPTSDSHLLLGPAAAVLPALLDAAWPDRKVDRPQGRTQDPTELRTERPPDPDARPG